MLCWWGGAVHIVCLAQVEHREKGWRRGNRGPSGLMWAHDWSTPPGDLPGEARAVRSDLRALPERWVARSPRKKGAPSFRSPP